MTKVDLIKKEISYISSSNSNRKEYGIGLHMILEEISKKANLYISDAIEIDIAARFIYNKCINNYKITKDEKWLLRCKAAADNIVYNKMSLRDTKELIKNKQFNSVEDVRAFYIKDDIINKLDSNTIIASIETENNYIGIV